MAVLRLGPPTQIYQQYLDKSVPFTAYRWAATAFVFLLFVLRIVFAQGWYIGLSSPFESRKPMMSRAGLDEHTIAPAITAQRKNYP